MRVTIYSDGGADPNPGIGGWAAILRTGGREKVLTGNHPQTTNNRMELQAAITALQALTRPSQVDFYTDSEYVRLGITSWIEKWAARGWQRKGKDIPNLDLWRQLWQLNQTHEIEWHWVRGHTGDPLNERVDELARRARLEITPAAQLAADAPRLFVRASCRGNPGPGGWGVVLERGHGTELTTEQLSGSARRTTNNRMELLAAIEGLKMLPPGSAAQLFTTSDYLFQGATRWIHGWRKRDWQKKDGQPVSNGDLWQELDRLLAGYRVHWINAKGDLYEDQPALDEAARLAAAAAKTAG
jgi:ribonuclease HI